MQQVNKEDDKIRILLIAANPSDKGIISSPKEFRDIKNSLQFVSNHKHYKVEQIEATRYQELENQLDEFKPHILHFIGHGEDNSILLENDKGKSEELSSKRLVKLIQLTNNNAECVILNLCDSEKIAKDISDFIDFSIGMNAPISNQNAIKFATAFYRGIGRKKCYQEAFERGQNAMPDATESSFESMATNPVKPLLFSPPLEDTKESDISIDSNQIPWFYHTIDHYQLPSLDLYNKSDNLIFGLFTAKGRDAPHSFAIHCCIEMLGGYCALDDDIDKKVIWVSLDGVDKNCFEKSILKHMQMETFQSPEVKNTNLIQQDTIQQWLLAQSETLVLHCFITKDQIKRVNIIIKGAMDSLSKLNLENKKILTLFRCETQPPKKWGVFNIKLPSGCEYMGELNQLKIDDIYNWLESLESKTQKKYHPEAKIIQTVQGKPFCYQDVLHHLHAIHHSVR